MLYENHSSFHTYFPMSNKTYLKVLLTQKVSFNNYFMLLKNHEARKKLCNSQQKVCALLKCFLYQWNYISVLNLERFSSFQSFQFYIG